MRKKRDKKEQKIAQKKHYDGLEAKTDERKLWQTSGNRHIRA